MDNTSLWQDLRDFGLALLNYGRAKVFSFARVFESFKSILATGLYRQRGKYVRPFIHLGMVVLVVGGITLGPLLISENQQKAWAEASFETGPALAAAETMTSTLISSKPRAETLEYIVQAGDTISTIAEKFGVSSDTIRWENDLTSVKTLKTGQKLRILPVTGVLYAVKRGDTIYSIAKKHGVDAQVIVDWPYNSFANDETFALAVGQDLIIPDGVKPKEVPIAPRTYYAQVPSAGAGTGQYVWPASGRITQAYSWYHRGIDIANSSSPDILAADTGTVIVTGWPLPWAYGNRVIIDHGGGVTTLYGHLSAVYVPVGARVGKGQPVGRMGSTGRSTGTHLHFEIRINGEGQNPLNYLK